MRLYYLLLYNTTHNHLYHNCDLFMLLSSYEMRVYFLLHYSFVLSFLAINSFLDISIIIFSSVRFYAAYFTWESSLCVKMFLANFFLTLTLIETQIIQQLGNNLFSFSLVLFVLNLFRRRIPLLIFLFLFFLSIK